MISRTAAILLAGLLAFICTVSGFSLAMVSQIVMKSELRFHPFTDIPQPKFGYVDGATVSVEVGCAKNHDKLFFTYQGNFNIDNTYDGERCVLYLVGHAPISEYIDAISTVVFFTDKEDFQPRRVTWTLGRGTFYNSLTNHFYRFQPFLAGAWQDAQTQCNNSKLMGMTGYLATVTSEEEMLGIGSKANMTMWIGMRADTSSGMKTNWKWAAGPENQTSQWWGNSMYEGGMPHPTKVGPAYSAWGRFQPTDLTSASTSDKRFVAVVPSLYEPVAYWQNMANTDGIQGYVCEYDDIMNPNLASEMKNWAGSVLLEFGCANYTSPTLCNNRAQFGCSYSAGQCRQTRCSIHPTSRDCSADSKCQWNADFLLGRCVNRRCTAYDTAETCTADPACTSIVAGGLSTCRDAICSDARDSCTCAGIEGCSWRNGKCGLDMTIGCDGMDVIYAFDASASMDQQFQQFTGGFQSMTDMLLSSQFTLTGTRAGVDPTGTPGMRVGFIRFNSRAETQTPGFGSSGQLTGDYNEAIADLTHLQQNFAPSPIRALDPVFKKASDMFSYSPAGRAKTIVVITGGDIGDAAGLQSNPSSSYNTLKSNGVKIVGVALRPQFPPSIATQKTDASLKALFMDDNAWVSTIMARLKTDGVYSICDLNTTLGNTVASTGRRDLCAHNLDADSCATMSVCAWSASAGMCVTSQCLSHCDAMNCSTDPTCQFVTATSTCEELCPSQTTATGCASKGMFCQWNTALGQCESQACYSNPNEDACIADEAGCYYNASSPIKCKPIECNFVSSSVCLDPVNAKHCSWNNKAGVCFRDACKIAGADKQRCVKNHECMVNDNGMCELHACAKSRTETQCNFDFNCQWDITFSPPACMPAPCTKYNQKPLTAQQMCTAPAVKDSCSWVPATGGLPARCEVVQCGFMKRSCDCARLPQCVWRNNQCKDSRYVQCPAIDVMFAIEGTEDMSKSFERHPNGFVGIIESIRSWSRDAPMTEDPAATGFRMGISAYGPLNTPWVVDTGVGAGNNFTGSPAEWLDADRMLSNIAQTQKTQSYTAGSDVALYPVLRNARLVFESNANGPSRTKMLVIIGNSPITDGGKKVREEIAALEALGVQIFSNVVRRFSTITPLDWKSAEYMMPVSSDAMSAHFMFTTIDDIRANLLDKFCDPSSNTGMALQVSRDRTLPCDWLVGSRECNMQGTCMWNSTAVPTCPFSTQCPNLDCMELPDALASKFTCSMCELKNGAFSCSRAAINAAPPGLCMQTPCMTNCDGASCTGTCEWKTPNTRCERNWCSSYTDLTSCNSDDGCVWDEFGANAPNGICRQSKCWANRALGSCSSQLIADAGGNREECLWNEAFSPAICQERRCDSLQKTDCKSLDALCTYDDGAINRACQHRECGKDNGEECELDSNCYWDPYGQKCNKRTIDCEISDFSKWTPCTASCGKGITYKARRIIQFPSDSRAAVSCAVRLNSLPGGEPYMVVTQNCKNVTEYAVGWEDDCNVYCANFNSDIAGCVRNMNCNWVSTGATGSCQPTSFIGCETMDKMGCDSSDMCTWSSDLSFCLPAVTQCRYTDADSCNRIGSCSWYTGVNHRGTAAGLGVDHTLFNPGQKPVFVFPTLNLATQAAATTTIVAASVMIENNYQAGKDKLDLALPTNIKIKWIPASGMLELTGQATVMDYATAISLVTFETTSTRTASRTITYSLGLKAGDSQTSNSSSAKVVYSATSSHAYMMYTTSSAVSYAKAAELCMQSTLHGRRGYLATIGSAEENDVIAIKLEGMGWLGADDSAGSWKWSQGPNPDQTVFWVGGSSLGAGYAVGGNFANWYQNGGEPTNEGLKTERALFLEQNSFWYAKQNSDNTVMNYVCEYGGLVGDSPADYPMGGSRVMGTGGCIPSMCSWHFNRGNCTADPECEWSNSAKSCKTGCLSRSTASECASSSTCFWDTTTFPATCQRDPCGGLGYRTCSSDTTGKCYWDGPAGKCSLKTGCAAIAGKADCDRSNTCEWFDNMGGCLTKPCTSLRNQMACNDNPLCEWLGGVCASALCKATDSDTCQQDKACIWSERPGGYIPNGGSVHPFEDATFAPNETATPLDGITIRITQGYHQGQDLLSMDQTPQMRSKFTAIWLPLYGTLMLSAPYKTNPVSAFEAFSLIKKYISFSTTSSRSNPRQFVVTFGLGAVYSPISANTSKVLKQVDQNTVYTTMAAAEARCQNTTFFGARGHLARPSNENDNIGLRSVQARGWIGAKLGNAGSWVWVNGTSFWTVANGLGSPVALAQPLPGTTYQFAQWASGQPSTGNTGAMVVNEGFWISVPDPLPVTKPLRGIVCEYASQEMTIQNFYGISYSGPKGCYPMPCAGLPEAICKKDPSCIWGQNGGLNPECFQDQWCANHPDPKNCAMYANCYWDHGLATCAVAPASACRGLSPTDCADVTGCDWDELLIPEPRAPVGSNNKGACVSTGCSIHPTKSACFSDPLCRWYTTESAPQGVCVERLCGYTTQTACWLDSKCVWDPNQVKCAPSECIGKSQTDCGNLAPCRWDTGKGMCLWERCSPRIDISSTAGFDKCLWDPTCLAKAGAGCIKPTCNYPTQKQCNDNKDCFYFTTAVAGGSNEGYCSAAQCTSQTSSKGCGGGEASDPCRWEGGACRQASPEEMSPKEYCVKQVDPDLSWLYVMIVIILILLVAILYRVYLAYAKGLNFFDPARKNVKFNAHSAYAAELYNFAQEGGVEENSYQNQQQQNAEEEDGAGAGGGEYYAGEATTGDYGNDYGEYNEDEHPDL